MLKEHKRQESMITVFFIVVLFCVGIYVLFDRSIEDVVYLGVLIYYFGKFLSSASLLVSLR